MSLPLRVLALFSVIFILQSTSSFASGTKTVYRGNSVSISWDVTNTTSNYNACSRNTSYPSGAVYNAWYGGGAQDPSGSVSLPAVTEVSGSPYSFECSNPPSGAYDSVLLYVTDCPDIPGNGPGYIWNGSACYNPAPSVDISAGASGVDIGGSVGYSSNGSDQGNDLTAHNFDWAIPSGSWNWQNGNQGGSTDSSPQLSFGGTSASSRSITFTPNTPGVYTLRFAVLDNNSTRWTSSSEVTLTVCDANHRWVAGWCQPIVKINSFSYTPSNSPDVDRGESAQLNWGIENATACSLSGGEFSGTNVGAANSGNITTSNLTSDTTYTLTCQGIGGPATSQVTVPVAYGSISSPISTCYIPVSQSACAITLSWSSINMSSPRLTDSTDATISSSASGSNLSRAIPYGDSIVFSLKNGSYVHGTVTTSASCVAGSSWNGSVCQPVNNDPIGNFEGGSCTITGWACDPDNYATPITVDLKVGATTIGSPLANITRDATVGAQCGGNRVHGFSFSMPSQYQNGIPVTVEATAINTPSGNNPSIGSQSVTCLNVSGDLTVSPSSCVIASGASSCTVGATWSTSNVASPSLVDGNTSVVLSTSANQVAPFTVYASFPSTTYLLKSASATELDRAVVTTSCAGGTLWNGTICAPTTSVTVGPLTSTPSTVNYNQTAVISWSGVANASPDCTLNGGEFSNVSVGTAGTGSRTTSALTSNTTYTLTCQGNGGPVSSSVTVNVASGNISASPSTCVIGMGQSTCSVALSWTTSNMTTPRVTQTFNSAETELYTTPLGSSVQRPVSFGNTTFALKNDTYTHSSTVVTASCASGSSWDISTGRCDPASTVTVGPLTSTPSTVNYNQTAVISWSGVANASPDCTLNGGEFSNVSLGTAGTGSRTTSALTSNTTYTLTCQGNGGPVSSSVTVNVASGNISASPSTCVIGMGQSTCSVALSWTTSNMTTPRVTNESDTTLYSSGSGASIPRSIPFGNSTFALKNGTFSHASVLTSATCAPGTAWSGTACVASTVTGSLSLDASSCTIASGQSTCTVNATWTTTNATAPQLVDFNTNAQLSTLASRATPFPVSVGYTQTEFRLKDGTSVIDSKTATASCASGTTWSGVLCAPIAPVTTGPLVATPSTVNYGGTTILSWSGVGNADSCTLSGGQFLNESVGTLTTGNRTTSALTGDTTYTLTCLGYNGPAVSTAVVRVASGDISASPTSCVINVNESTCNVGVTWNTLNMEEPRMTDGLDNTLSTNATGAGVQQPVSYGNNTFVIKNGSISHNSVLVNAVCDSSSKWTGTVCAPATATINSADCIIAKNAASCSVNVIWSTSNTASAVTVVRPYAGNSVFANGASGNIPASFPAGQFNLDVKQGNTLLNTGTYNATCAAGSAWNGTICLETTNVTVGLLSATPPLVNYNVGTVLSWNGVANATACTLDGGEFNNVSVGTNETGSQITSPLTSDTTYTLSCSGPGGPKTSDVTVYVASGNISAVPSSCTILSGQNRCTVGLTWTSVHMSTPRVTSQSGELISTSANGSGVTRLVSQGLTTFSLSNGAVVHGSTVVSASCESGTAWNGDVCAPASGSINSSSCTITAGNATCNAPVIWSTANTGATVTVTGPSPSVAVLRSGASGNTSIAFTYGTNYLDLRLDGNITATGVYLATCEVGTLWTGTLCGLSGIGGDLIVSSNECLIPTGFSTCTVNGSWTTSGATNPSLFNETTGSVLSRDPVQSTPIALQVAYPGVRFLLRENATPIDFENVSARCAAGGLDNEGGRCANPSVISAVVTGQYYAASGNIAISCSNSNKYRVVGTDTGTVIVNNAAYAGVVRNVSVSQSGNYTIYCMQGDYKSAPVVRYYNAGPAPSPTLVLSASPRTVSKASDATISWTIQHPKANCSLNARTVCSGGICNENQIAEQDAINQKIATEYTDTASIQNALTGNARSILASLRTIPSDRVNTDWKTEGKKTFNIDYSTEFVLSCGDQVSQAVRIQVTRTGEQ